MRIKNAVRDFLGSNRTTDEISGEAVKYLVMFSVVLGSTLIISNLAALRIWQLGNIPVDAGIFLFPLSYVVGDLLVAIYGKYTANLVSFYAAVMGMLTIVAFWAIGNFLPIYPGTDSESFAIVQSATGRIFFASILGFLASQLVNNFVFTAMGDRLKQATAQYDAPSSLEDDHFSWQAFASSCLARIPDVIIFETVAFLGILSFAEFLRQAFYAYLFGCVWELVLTLTVSKRAARKLKYRLQYYDGHYLP